VTDKPEKKPEIEVVYLGPVSLTGGKKGTLFIPREWLAERPTATFEEVWQAASPFSHIRSAPIVGAAYKSTGEIVDGKLNRLGIGALRISGRVEHAALVEFELRAEAAAEEDKLAAVERKLKAEPRLTKEIERLAYFLAKTPWSKRQATEHAIMQAIRDAARRVS
jgi:hypothetical protein